MRRILVLVLAIALSIGLLSSGCSFLGSSSSKVAAALAGMAADPDYKNVISSDNKPRILRHPGPADFSLYYPDKLDKLPSYNPDSGQMWQVDLRSRDASGLDLSYGLSDLLYSDFDSKTKWPAKLPAGFSPEKIMELGKNPGLGVRELHKKGITGKGVGIAIIDQTLLVDHEEYKDRLKMYEEIHDLYEGGGVAMMHGPAVASIAVGKNIGVAPEADLYYIAETHGVIKGQGDFEWDLSWLAMSIDRIVEINKALPKKNKIRVISISLGIGSGFNGDEKALASIEKAEKQGIYVAYVDSDPCFGLGRDPLKSADELSSYAKGIFWSKQTFDNNRLLVPMDSRCTASPTGTSDYVFYREGGASWTVPYIAGLYALACQVKPDVTPEIFWDAAIKTGDTIETGSVGNKGSLGLIANPAKMLDEIKKAE